MATVVVRYHNVIVTVTAERAGALQPRHLRARLPWPAVGRRPGLRPGGRGRVALAPRPDRGSPLAGATRLGGVLVVGFDTATPAVSVALHDGERVVSEAFAARRQAALRTAHADDREGHGRRRRRARRPHRGRGRGGSRALHRAAGGRGDRPGARRRPGPAGVRRVLAGRDRRRGRGRAAAAGSSSWPPTPGAGRSTGRATTRPAAAWTGPAVGPASSIPGAAACSVAGAGGPLYPEAFGEVIGPAYPTQDAVHAVAEAGQPGRWLQSRPSAPAPALRPGPGRRCSRPSRCTCAARTPGSPGRRSGSRPGRGRPRSPPGA